MKRIKVLLVDDDEAVLEFMRAKLGPRYELVTSSDAGAVIPLARERRPDVIICDVDMPGTDGGDVSAALYAADDMRDIPLIFLTALVSEQDLARSKGQLGGRPAHAKTAPVEQLMDRIDALAKG